MSSGFEDSFREQENELSVERDRKLRRERTLDEKSLREGDYLFRLGRKPIHLTLVEFKIIQFLSQRSYHAFRRSEIVDAVTSEETPVTDENLDKYIRSLRDKLGLFSDYVQTVPYIGFRFKP